jgi:NTE family protein
MRLAAFLGVLLLAGCSTYHPWKNAPGQSSDAALRASHPVEQPVFVAVSLSGGGARAAAFGLGVLRELKATQFVLAGQPTSLLDQVTLVSGVSGGSILAAHFAAFGDESLATFESEFLLKDFEGSLVQLALSPRRLYRLSSPWYGRSHVLAEQLDALYRGRTFGDLRKRPRSPDLIVTATDLTTGAPFEFTPEQFALICSDFASVPLSFAVAASSAVPVLLSPVSLRNFAGTCELPALAVPGSAEDNFRTRLLRASADSYRDAGKRPYIHLVDGGLNDNLGIRTLLDRVVAKGSLADSFRDAAPGSIRHVVVVAVNSERDLGERIDHSDRVPSTRQVVETLLFGAGGQITQFTLALLSDDQARWRRELAEQRGALGSPFAADAELHVIAVSLHDVPDSGLRQAVITVPTAFTIDPLQVKHLIAAGGEALRRSPEFQQLLRSLAAGAREQDAVAVDGEQPPPPRRKPDTAVDDRRNTTSDQRSTAPAKAQEGGAVNLPGILHARDPAEPSATIDGARLADFSFNP